MKRILVFSRRASLAIGLAALVLSTGCTGDSRSGKLAAPVPLFNGVDLTGWVIVPQGDPVAQASWSVQDGVLRTTGVPNGYVRTVETYGDYTLRLEWRWVPVPAPVDAQGRPRNRNSGVLLHMQGEDKVWPRSLEAQLMETNAGDFYSIDGVEFTELGQAREKALAAAADDNARQQAQRLRRIARQQGSSEKPTGEWNAYEITCRGDSMELKVNGVLQNSATGISVSKGHICLQSEGVPIEFRNVVLEPLK
jgi:hypothetical protein